MDGRFQHRKVKKLISKQKQSGRPRDDTYKPSRRLKENYGKNTGSVWRISLSLETVTKNSIQVNRRYSSAPLNP